MTVLDHLKTCNAYAARWAKHVGPYLMCIALGVGIWAGVTARSVDSARANDAREADMVQVLSQRGTCLFGNGQRADTRVKDVRIQAAVQNEVYRVIGERYFELTPEQAAEVGQVAADAAAGAALAETNNLTAPDRDCVAIYPPPIGISEDELQSFAAASATSPGAN